MSRDAYWYAHHCWICEAELLFGVVPRPEESAVSGLHCIECNMPVCSSCVDDTLPNVCSRCSVAARLDSEESPIVRLDENLGWVQGIPENPLVPFRVLAGPYSYMDLELPRGSYYFDGDMRIRGPYPTADVAIRMSRECPRE